MAYDGNGTFVRLHNWTQDAANSIDINSGEMDGEDNGFATGLSNAVTRDGQGKMTTDFLPAVDNTLNLGSAIKRWTTLNGTPFVQFPTYPLTANESAASVTPQVFSYPSANVVANVFRYLTAAQQANVSLNIGSIDCAAAIQGAVNANPNAELYFPPGKYLILSQINILKAIRIRGTPGQSTFILGTQNQNGFVVGDGTLATRAACFNTYIEGIAFNPSASVAAFTSGICIFFNYTAFVFLRDITFFGSNGTSSILFEGVRAYQTVEWEVYKCRFTLMLGIGMNCFGTSATTFQTNDGRIDVCEFTSVVNDAIYIGAFANGITINQPICYADTHNVIHIDTTGAGKPYNIFILQPDIELDNAGIIAINCTDGVGLKQVVGGWIGMGSLAIAATACSVASTSGGLFWENVNCTQTNLVLSGPSCTIVGGEVSGDNATTPTGITVNVGATDTQIVGVRVRQWITSGITFVSQPQRCMVDGVIFKANGVDFTGQNYTNTGLQPQISGCRTDAIVTILPAATIVLHPALPFYQLSGATTTVTTMSAFSQGQRVTFQALDAAGDTFSSGGNVLLKTAPTTIPQFKSMSFVCDGANWFEDGRNF